MTPCLNDEQLEDALAGNPAPDASAHLAECAACRGRLADAVQLRDRLRNAFKSLHAPPELAERIAAATAGAPGRPDAPVSGHRSWGRRYWPSLAAAAAILAVASLAAVWPYLRPAPANAAVSELVRIHEQVLNDPDQFATHDGVDAQAYLSRQLGFTPAVPDDPGDPRMRACCISQFLGAKAGAMVVDGPTRPITLVVAQVNGNPLRSSGRDIRKGGRTFWVCPMKGYVTVAVQEGRLIYCAVGEDSAEDLAAVLNRILDRRPGNPG